MAQYLLILVATFATMSGLALLGVVAFARGDGSQALFDFAAVSSLGSLIPLMLIGHYQLGTARRKRPLALTGIVGIVGGVAVPFLVTVWGGGGPVTTGSQAVGISGLAAFMIGMGLLGYVFWERKGSWRGLGIANFAFVGTYVVLLYRTLFEGAGLTSATGSIPLALYLVFGGGFVLFGTHLKEEARQPSPQSAAFDTSSAENVTKLADGPFEPRVHGTGSKPSDTDEPLYSLQDGNTAYTPEELVQGILVGDLPGSVLVRSDEMVMWLRADQVPSIARRLSDASPSSDEDGGVG